MNAGVLVSNVALVAVQQGDYDAAVPLFEESLSIMRDLGDNQGQTEASFGLGSVANHRGRYDEAVELFEECLRFPKNEGDARLVAEAFAQLALAAVGQGDFERAAKLLGASTAHFEQIGASPSRADRPRFDAAADRARAELGDVGEHAYAAGRALTRDEAIAFALREPSSG